MRISMILQKLREVCENTLVICCNIKTYNG